MEEEREGCARDGGRRPGFLIRRLHQIYEALFAEECAGMEVSPLQYSLMCVAEQQPGMDLAQICAQIAIDRATLGHLVERLEAAGLLKRTVSLLDRRQKLLSLTLKGEGLLRDLHEPAARADRRLFEGLAPAEHVAFRAMLRAAVAAGRGR